MATRFRPGAGVIQSWDEDRGWQALRGWSCPAIIDNMMNLELLFEATCLSGDSSYWKMAVSHADVTMAHHFRADYSTYHAVDYDKLTGEVRSGCTAQGYSDSSCWARGEAWAIYGYTMCYRYTHDKRYLEQAKHVYDYIFAAPICQATEFLIGTIMPPIFQIPLEMLPLRQLHVRRSMNCVNGFRNTKLRPMHFLRV